MQAYASLLRYGNADLVGQNSAKAVARGYTNIKLHEIGAAEIAAARAAIGPGHRAHRRRELRLVRAASHRHGKELKPQHLTWLEEPLWPPEDYAGLAKLKAEGEGMPIAAGENAGTLADIAQFIDVAGVDYIQPSVTKIGGVSALIKVAEMARRAGIKIAPHSPYFGPGLIATIHFAASHPERPVDRTLLCRHGSQPARRTGRSARWFHARAQRAGARHRGRRSGAEKYRAS